MRLVCPNCGAQYDVGDEAIPAAGRDVQCSNCGHGWFATHDADPKPSTPQAETVQAPDRETSAAPAPTNYHGLDPEVAAVLQEEAEREARTREAERRSALETQTEMGLSEGLAQRRVSGPEGAQAEIEAADESFTTPPAAVSAQGEALPDVESLNSSLRGENPDPYSTETMVPVAPTGRARSRGFRWGFWIIVLVAVALALCYFYAPQIKSAAPQFGSALDTYVAYVDDARLWLDAQVSPLLNR